MSKRNPEQRSGIQPLSQGIRIEKPKDAELFTRRMAELESIRGLVASRIDDIAQRGESDIEELTSITEQEARVLSDIAWFHALWQVHVPIGIILTIADLKDETARQIKSGEAQIAFQMVIGKKKSG